MNTREILDFIKKDIVRYEYAISLSEERCASWVCTSFGCSKYIAKKVANAIYIGLI